MLCAVDGAPLMVFTALGSSLFQSYTGLYQPAGLCLDGSLDRFRFLGGFLVSSAAVTGPLCHFLALLYLRCVACYVWLGQLGQVAFSISVMYSGWGTSDGLYHSWVIPLSELYGVVSTCWSLFRRVP
ncbi:hypothetical protein BC832DRAFT_553164 [Gaertneriomyces semiglobifer]|nr:hypothetical protein BC832DRAFT_553164 [Gaertneriomyces semiglobifer]